MGDKRFNEIKKILKNSQNPFAGYPHRRHRKSKRIKSGNKYELMAKIIDREHKMEIINSYKEI